MQFDSQLSESRYQVVVSLFDQMVTFRLKELPQAATKAIYEADRKLQARPNARGAELLKQARGYAAGGRRHGEEQAVPRALSQEPA